MKLDELHQLLLQRNALETLPFVAVHEANSTLLNQVDALQLKCEALERQNAALDLSAAGRSGSKGDTAALRNETRLREKVEKLQEELNEILRGKEKDTAQALENANAAADEIGSGWDSAFKAIESVGKLAEGVSGFVMPKLG